VYLARVEAPRASRSDVVFIKIAVGKVIPLIVLKRGNKKKAYQGKSYCGKK